MSGNLLSHSNSFGFEMEKDAAGCRALNRNIIVGECDMSYDETMFGTAPPFSFEETEGYEEKDLSASLTLRWSRKRRRWECDNAYFWHEFQNKWCCRSEDGRYYHGFRSLRALLKSYVGGRLCESSCCYSARNVRAKYWFSQHPKTVTCCVIIRCTGLFPALFAEGGITL